MSKSKKKFGLQKDFSSIFEGVWIPPKGRGRDAQAEPGEQDRQAENEKSAVQSQDTTAEVRKPDEQEQSAQPPVVDEPSRTTEPEPVMPQNRVSDHATPAQEIPAVEMPPPHEEQFDEEADAGFQPNPEIEKIIRSMKCSKGFICYKSNFQQLCKVNNIGEGKIIECSPLNHGPCAYRFSFMGKVFCKCPLRYYIARNLGM